MLLYNQDVFVLPVDCMYKISASSPVAELPLEHQQKILSRLVKSLRFSPDDPTTPIVSQRRLERIIGIGYATIRDYEYGSVNPLAISPEYRSKLARALGMTEQEFIETLRFGWYISGMEPTEVLASIRAIDDPAKLLEIAQTALARIGQINHQVLRPADEDPEELPFPEPNERLLKLVKNYQEQKELSDDQFLLIAQAFGIPAEVLEQIKAGEAITVQTVGHFSRMLGIQFDELLLDLGLAN